METREILDLFDKFEKSSLSEIAIKQGEFEVTMKKQGEMPVFQPQVAQVAHLTQQATGQTVAADKPALKKSDAEIIESPMVGTFYRAPAPDAPPFVDVGARFKKGQTLCILEAMKLMNEFEAEFDGEITAILVENGKMVEYGTPLFEVKKA